MSPYNPKSAFTSESARKAQAKRKARHNQFSGQADVSDKMRELAKLRWEKTNAKSQEETPSQEKPDSEDEAIVQV